MKEYECVLPWKAGTGCEVWSAIQVSQLGSHHWLLGSTHTGRKQKLGAESSNPACSKLIKSNQSINPTTFNSV